MILKPIVFILLLGSIKFLYSSCARKNIMVETPIDKAWWEGLSEEWKNILLINQIFHNQQVDFSALQNGYINRMKSENEEDYSEMNKSLHDYIEMKKFSLGYSDFYARAKRYNHAIKNESIDLESLGDLDKIYMVNGPGDLTPLKKFPNLKILILNDCGIDNTIPIDKQLLDLGPLRNLLKLKLLHCSSNALKSIEPIKELNELQELRIDNSSVTDISPLKNLVNLELLALGSKVKSASVISRLPGLRALYLKGCKNIPDLSKLKKLNRLSIEENELAIIDGSYRIKNIAFLSALTNLEYLDLDYTSYNGSLVPLDSLHNLKAITLPPVNTSTMLEFKKNHNNCVIINISIDG